MAEKRLSELDAITTTQNTDLVELSQDDGVGGFVSKKITVGNLMPSSAKAGAFGITIDGGATVLTTGLKNWVSIPFPCTIRNWSLLADASGSIVIDVWKNTQSNFPPTVSDSIAGSEKPNLSSQTNNSDNSLTTWATSVSAGDIIAFNIDSVSGIHKVTLTIGVIKT